MFMSDATKAPRRLLTSIETWAAIAACALVVAIVIGILPRLPW
jgi:hypothetical protein